MCGSGAGAFGCCLLDGGAGTDCPYAAHPEISAAAVNTKSVTLLIEACVNLLF